MFSLNKKKRTCRASSYIYTEAMMCRKSESYKGQIRKNAERLEAYEKSRGIEIRSDSLTYEVCEDFALFLRSQNLLENTVSSILSKMFTSFNRMHDDGFSVNLSYKNFKLKKEEVFTIYLSISEIEALINLRLGKENSIIRDLFVIGCYTGLRYSDLSQLTEKNIQGCCIIRKTKKTGVTVQIPINTIVRRIIEKNGGIPQYRSTSQNYNQQIKRICKRAGITEKMFIERTRGGRPERISIPKYKLVSSHTARRTFATNTYLAGIPAARIMLLTGHKTESSFFLYIRISRQENARTLSRHPFFN